MDAGTPFSYQCRRCGNCCIDKRIQVNPYEIARLARNRGVGTAQARADFTDGNAALRQRDDGACIFFDRSAGCRVHADRPLVCRLFPLGRRIDETGTVSYRLGAFEPPPSGEFGEDGTIDGFLNAQGAQPFITFADAYFRWYIKATGEGAAHRTGMNLPSDLLDIDTVLGEHCARTGRGEPASVEARAALHLEILDDLVVVAGES